MNKRHFLLALTAIALATTLVHAQPGGRRGGMGGPSGPKFGGAWQRLFDEHKSFNAAIVMSSKSGPMADAMVPGTIAYDEGLSRFEMDISKIEGGRMPPGMGEQLRAMGMAEIVVITRPDKKIAYMIYPGAEAYAENALTEEQTGEGAKKFKVEITKLGEEKVDGHPCVKNKVVITDDKDQKHEATTWAATDLKNFPVKIEMEQDGGLVTLNFADVKFGKPAAAQFEVSKGFTKYESMQTLMQGIMMKQLGGGGGFPPPPKQ